MWKNPERNNFMGNLNKTRKTNNFKKVLKALDKQINI